MPHIRRTLIKAELQDYLLRAETLRASGVEIDVPENWRERNRRLDIILASIAESRVFESQTGGTFYAVTVRLVARAPIILTDCDIRTGFDDQVVMESFRGPVCRLGGTDYLPGEVLNHRIEHGLRLSRGGVAEGTLLASGLRRVPMKSGNSSVPFEIVFSDQFGQEFRAEGNLSVSRVVRREDTSARRGTGLYGLDDARTPRELLPSKESGQRYRELILQEQACRAPNLFVDAPRPQKRDTAVTCVGGM